MGGVFSRVESGRRGHRRRGRSGNRSIVTRGISSSPSSYPYHPSSYPYHPSSYPYHPGIMSSEPPSSLCNTASPTPTGSDSKSQAKAGSKLDKKQSIKQKYSFIPDNFSSLEQV
ncbi:hypothetical protein OIU77_013745 [Salix suchowensis]|uniref:Uncharacterized protein n=1 Tax=Salix suchowensis TaxID=1278906 RepID=A0ABQ8ZVB7_9ROSI|nr:hypothetical protein OIU77_013745 [Salix suchowensis]